MDSFKTIKLRSLLFWNLFIFFWVLLIDSSIEKILHVSLIKSGPFVIYLLDFLYLIRLFKKHKISIKKLLNNNVGSKVPWLKCILIEIGVLVLSLVVACLFIYFISMVNQPFIINMLNNSNDQSTRNSFYDLITSVILAPVVEELTFRGIIFNKWSQRFGLLKSLILSSLVFSILHIGTFYLPQLLCGVFFGLAYIKTRKLYVSMILHGIFNGVLTLSTFIDNGPNSSSKPTDLTDQIRFINELGVFSIILFIILLPLMIWAYYKLYKSSLKLSPYEDLVDQNVTEQTVNY